MVRKGFTLVELVMVVLILGILAAVAVPKVINNADEAAEANLLRTLAVVRDAIEMYATLHGGAFPGADGTEATFKYDLKPHIRRRFPMNQMKGSDAVDVQTTGDPLGFQSGPYGWRYDNQTGQFIANSNGMSSDGVTRYREL